MLAEEFAKVVTQVDLMNALKDLRLLILGLSVLVLLVGFFVTRGQRRIAKNQIALAKMLQGGCCQGGGED
jgi:hypothetical protein